MQPSPARALWQCIAPYHAVTYFTDEARAAFEDAGWRGFWRGYFAGRAAPLGAVGAEVVVATFYGFRPDFVARAVPNVWSIASPEAAIGARETGAGRALARLFDVRAADIARAARLMLQATDGCDPSARWDDDDWCAAAGRLAERGWIDDDGAVTAAARDAHAAIEADTDRMAQGPMRALGEDRLVELLGITRPLAAALAVSGTIPFPNPIGVLPASTS